MTGKLARQIKRQFPGCAKKFNKAADMLRKSMLVQASQPDIQEVVFAKTPAIALDIAAEIKLRNFRLDVAGTSLVRIHLELNFLGHHRLIAIGVSQMPRDGTKMAASPNQQSGFELAIDDPAFT